MADPAGHVDEVDRPVAKDLIRDVEVATLRVARRRRVHMAFEATRFYGSLWIAFRVGETAYQFAQPWPLMSPGCVSASSPS